MALEHQSLNELPPPGLQDLFQTLASKKKQIAAIALLISALSVFAALIKPSEYKAAVLLQIHHSEGNSLGAIAGTPDDSTHPNVTSEPLSAQISLIRSKFILEAVVKSGNDAGLTAVTDLSGQINRLRAHLTVTDLTGLAENFPDKPAVIQLSLTGKDPGETMQTVNTIAEITRKKDLERKTNEARRTLDFFYQQLALSQEALRQAEESLNNSRIEGSKIDAKVQTQNLLGRLSDTDRKIEATHLKKMELSQRYTLQHPFIMALVKQEAELRRQRKDIYDQLKKMIVTDHVSDSLKRQAEAKKNLYMTLLNKIHLQRVITAGIVSDIRILSPATFSETVRPLKPQLAGIFGLIVGTVLGGLWVLFQKSFKTVL